MAREVPGRPGFLFGLEDEPFVSGYAALAAGDHRRRRRGGDPARRCRRPARSAGRSALTATLRVRDGSGRPVERSVTRPLLPAAPLIGVRPLFDGAVDEGGTAGFEAIAARPRSRARRPRRRRAGRCRGSRPTSSGTRPTASGTTSRSPGAAGSRTARVDLGRGRAGAARPARRLGPLRARRSPPPTAATSRRASASTPAGARPAPARRRRTSSSSASTATPTPPATPPAPASSRRTPASSSSR